MNGGIVEPPAAMDRSAWVCTRPLPAFPARDHPNIFQGFAVMPAPLADPAGVLRFALLPADTVAGSEVLERYGELALVAVDGPPPQAWASWTDLDPVSVNGVARVLPPGVFAPGAGPRCILRFAGPIAPAWRETLAGLGWAVRFDCPPFALCADIGPDVDALRAALPALRAIGPYEAGDCARAGSGQVDALPRTFDAVAFTEEDRVRLEKDLAEAGLQVLETSRYKLRVVGGPEAVGHLRDAVGVKIADPGALPRLASASLGLAIGVVPAPATPTDDDRPGAGELIAFADTGLGTGEPGAPHPDFASRVHAIHSWPISPGWAAFVRTPGADDGGADRGTGHGTHVAGLAVGDGSMSAGRLCGIAPGARILMQAIEQYIDPLPAWRSQLQPGFYLAGRPLDLRELLEQARAAGAAIHANAWGVEAGGAYTDDSWECDHFLHAHPEMLLVFAAGNAGRDRNRDGRVDPGTLYAPASAKNVLSVGATEGPDVGVGLRSGWAALDPTGTRFPDPALRAAPVSGDPARLALLSSCGPTLDARIKPELCAPGTNLAAPRSTATSARGWGLANPLPWYQYLGGTSMATGVVAGAAAVLRQRWRHVLGEAPGGAALKALLIQGAQPVQRRDGSGDEDRQCAGFGRLWLAGSLPATDGPVLVEDRDGLATGGLRQIAWHGPGRLRAVLCWYDAPGETLVNDLDLVLLDAGGQVRAWGNHPVGAFGSPDRRNTVECIDVELGAGAWTLQVRGVNVPHAPQPWALAMSPGAGLPVVPEPATPEPPPEPAPEPDPEGGTPVLRWRLALPWSAIRGVGAARARSLETALPGGLAALCAGVPDAAALGFLPAALRRQIQDVAAFVSVPPPAAAALAWAFAARRLLDEPPDGASAADWQALVAALAPVLDALDRSVARVVCGDTLFR
jgi:hypothetical protein